MRKRKANWEVYIIETEDGKLYTGITTDLDKRFKAHLEGTKGARFFRFSKPRTILFREKHKNRSRATKREIAIKKMSHAEKRVLQPSN
jgi:putative endonuclease